MNSNSKTRLWTGRILWALSVPFMLLDVAMHIMKPPPVLEAFHRLGFPVSDAVGLGVLVLVLLTLYVYPHTAFLGAILLTGYLGGAVAIHVRVGESPFFPIFVAALFWGSLYCRDSRIPKLLTSQ